MRRDPSLRLWLDQAVAAADDDGSAANNNKRTTTRFGRAGCATDGNRLRQDKRGLELLASRGRDSRREVAAERRGEREEGSHFQQAARRRFPFFGQPEDRHLRAGVDAGARVYAARTAGRDGAGGAMGGLWLCVPCVVDGDRQQLDRRLLAERPSGPRHEHTRERAGRVLLRRTLCVSLRPLGDWSGSVKHRGAGSNGRGRGHGNAHGGRHVGQRVCAGHRDIGADRRRCVERNLRDCLGRTSLDQAVGRVDILGEHRHERALLAHL